MIGGKLLLGFSILRCIILRGDPVTAVKWPSALQEAFDERNDAEIFRAVVDSMREWESHRRSSHRWKRDASSVCYEDIGCFEDTGPFGYLEMLPSHPKDVGTRFLVYGSRKARSIPMEVPAGDINDQVPQAIDPELPTKVIVHGFGSSCDHIWVYEMRSALMSVHECNIICVDWGPGSAVPNYVRAAANTRLVGRQLAKLVRSLNVPLKRVHLIGFSLGAHVAGFAGAELGNVSRITGLDPAGPLFESQDPRARLDATDAHFVDVIHSNGEQLILGGLGSWQPMGDVDFYPNGGRMQTGCSNLFLGAVSDIIWSSAVEGRSLCNHRRAYKLFTDSVSPRCRFPAFPCDHGYDGLLRGDCFPCGVNGADRPCGDMGYYSNESPARGQLYLVTREEEPFCAHQYQLKLYNSRGERPARSYGKLQITLIGEGSLNETFTMTRKDDEELLVGSILHKIVVPHPAVTTLEAIEVRYTAYSGWISSGLVTWNIDKVAIIDSFGKSLSVCKRGLILESGRPVSLPLYPGECNIPPEPETTLPPSTTVYADEFVQDKQGGIGPFTKEQNFDKEMFSDEVLSEERTRPQKGLGPFTKDQNPKLYDEKETFKPQNIFSKVKVSNGDPEGNQQTPNPWAVADLNDGESNSLENPESESGRGFSDPNPIQKTPAATTSIAKTFDFTTEFFGEIQEPVLKLSKKETGRSLKLPEITEPILRPRPARQNEKDSYRRDKQLDQSATASRGFTVQFLPERLAGILAQAERYARQTLLPLISQYTPSFVGGARNNEPKYFPPLGDIANESLEDTYSREIVNKDDESRSRGTKDDKNDEPEDESSEASAEHGQSLGTDSGENHREESKDDREQVSSTSTTEAPTETMHTTEQASAGDETESHGGSSEMAKSTNSQDEWIPMERNPVDTSAVDRSNNSRSLQNDDSARTQTEKDEFTKDINKYEGKWLTEESAVWSPRVEIDKDVPDSKVDDWVPIIAGNNNNNVTKSEQTTSRSESADAHVEKSDKLLDKSNDIEKPKEDEAIAKEDDRKYIPLIDFANPDEFFVSSTSSSPIKSTVNSTTTEAGPVSHIQKIPGPSKTDETVAKPLVSRAMIFPYAYERKKDPRTRYIPLLPQEDVGRPNPFYEKDR